LEELLEFAEKRKILPEELGEAVEKGYAFVKMFENPWDSDKFYRRRHYMDTESIDDDILFWKRWNYRCDKREFARKQ